MKEFIRKKVAWLKRNPHMIALILVVIACCIFTFDLSDYSSASVGLYQEAYIQTIRDNVDPNFSVPGLYRNPAIYMFVQTLFSILLVITYLSSYKKGKKNNLMFIVTLVMIGVMIVCDVLYYLSLDFYTTKFPVGWCSPETEEIAGAMMNSIMHVISLGVALACILLTPVFSKLLGLINTSVDDEYDRLMEAKSDEELMVELVEDE